MAEDLFNSEVTIAESTYHRIKRLDITVPAGKTLKIETTPDGEEIGAGVVPVDKEADVEISLVVKFRDI